MRDISIEIKDLYYKYPDGYEALKGICLTLYKGESLGIVGSNGAGKSTLLLQLTGINRPSSGKIEINSLEVNKNNLAQIRKDIGFVFQNPEDQLFTTSIYEDVAFGPKNYKLSKQEVDKRVTESLEKVGILELKNRAPYRLSGGQKNLAAIATAISMDPSILIMDEPTSALDPKARRKLINLLNSFDYTKIIASHDLDMILDTCERTIVLKNGEIVADEDTQNILLDKDLMEECDLELPLSCQKRKFD
ncbi:energy-coupling factor ABC transporter ATP-binding protein [Intestinibacter bartlettii]|uniref:energy-coupling factor ABC transporter ATP-binding protein n=1 Tax=Intestinibacter bartlettii TaxID=261299 RepID=UPI001D1107BC|nr:ABC transporter ATP-binding protein [Intestinibacter bartlettii]MCC2706296.1 energy-coupling factor ABC transporter ATP-binding protein [Intestinibacter bartlettii]MCC2761746.1 energy-coupling factor ABC transporter ATP-binding protein [Intestinibacter bartlettii]